MVYNKVEVVQQKIRNKGLMRNCENLNIRLSYPGRPEDERAFITIGTSEGELYLMLTVKRSIMTAKLVEALGKEFGVTGAMVGIAFDYQQSVQQGKLVLITDPTINGIYILFSDFKGAVCQMLNR